MAGASSLPSTARTPVHLPSLRGPTTVLNSKPVSLSIKAHRMKWAPRSSLFEQSQSQDLKNLVEFLYDDLHHLFDDRGIDRSMYGCRPVPRPVTKHDSIAGYLFNIRHLKSLFTPQFELQSVRQTGPYEITTRWTMVMTFVLLPWIGLHRSLDDG